MPDRSSQPVQPPDHQGVAGSELIQHLRQCGTRIQGTGGGVDEHPVTAATRPRAPTHEVTCLPLSGRVPARTGPTPRTGGTPAGHPVRWCRSTRSATGTRSRGFPVSKDQQLGDVTSTCRTLRRGWGDLGGSLPGGDGICLLYTSDAADEEDSV